METKREEQTEPSEPYGGSERDGDTQVRHAHICAGQPSWFSERMREEYIYLFLLHTSASVSA